MDSDTTEDEYEATGETKEELDGECDGNTSPEKKNKKKKKKKKKKTAQDESGTAGQETRPQPEVLPDAEARYSQALDSLRCNDETGMWISLKNCNIGDKKVKKLVDLLKNNDTVTSINLDNNVISEGGFQNLAAALGSGSAKNLIELSVRTSANTDSVQNIWDGLTKLRKNLSIEYEPIVEESPSPSTANVDADTSAPTSSPESEKLFEKSPPKTGKVPNFDLDLEEEDLDDIDGDVVVEGFEPNDVDADWDELREERDHSLLPSDAADDMVAECLQLAGEGWEAPPLGVALQNLAKALDEDTGDGIIGTNVPLRQLPPIVKKLIAKLDGFVDILDLEPRSVLTQYGSGVPQRAVGTHRVFAVEIFVRILQIGAEELDMKLAETDASLKIVNLLLDYPWANSAHGVCLQYLQNALSVPPLAKQLLEGGEKSLPNRLAKLGSTAADQGVSRRNGNVGHIMVLSKLLVSMQNSDDVSTAMKQLGENTSWCNYIAEDGPLSRLVNQQEGNLCGPKPNRISPLGTGGMGGGGGGNSLINGRDLLAMLQGLRMSS